MTPPLADSRPVAAHLPGLVLLLAALIVAGIWAQQQASLQRQPVLLAEWYPAEWNGRFEYRFARPRSQALVPERLPSHPLLELRLFSPAPLPPRLLTLRLGMWRAFTVPVDTTPRTYRVLLPEVPADPLRGRLLLFESPAARAPDDPRDLGVLTQTAQVVGLNPPSLAGMQVLAYGLAVLGSGVLWFGLRPAWMRLGVAAGAWVAQHPHGALASMLAGAYTIMLSAVSIANHEAYRTSTYDLGFFDQSLWLVSQGLHPYNTAMGLHVLGDHASLLLYPLSLLYLIWPDVRFLLIAQSLVIGMAAVPLYLIGRQWGAPRLGLLAGMAFLLHPGTLNLNLIDVHPDAFAGTALLVALLGAERRDWRLVLVGALVVLAAKENFALTVAFLGFWLIMRRMWRIGGFLLVIGVAWLLWSTQVLLPSLNGQATPLHLSRFDRFGATPADIAATFLLHPQQVLADLFSTRNLDYLAQVFGPLGGLSLLGLPYVILAAPALALNLLSDYPPQQTLLYHYTALILPISTVAALHGAILLRRVRRWSRPLLVLAGLLAILAWYPAITSNDSRLAVFVRMPPDERVAVQRYVLAHIPADAGVSAQTELHPHLTHRRWSFMFPNPFVPVVFYNPRALPPQADVGYVILDTRRPNERYLPFRNQQEVLQQLIASRQFRVALELDGIVLLERNR